MYDALLWKYESQKIKKEAVSDSEITEKVCSRLEAPRIDREYTISDSMNCSKLVPTKKN